MWADVPMHSYTCLTGEAALVSKSYLYSSLHVHPLTSSNPVENRVQKKRRLSRRRRPMAAHGLLETRWGRRAMEAMMTSRLKRPQKPKAATSRLVIQTMGLPGRRLLPNYEPLPKDVKMMYKGMFEISVLLSCPLLKS
jgi:hypothetical protein